MQLIILESNYMIEIHAQIEADSSDTMNVIVPIADAIDTIVRDVWATLINLSTRKIHTNT